MICSVEACGRTTKARGWCDLHYKRWRVHGDPLAYRKIRKRCTVDECDAFVHGRGMCRMHYKRAARHGDPRVKHNRWTTGEGRAKVGTRYFDRHSGYVRVYDPEHANANANGCVKEHTWVMSRHLGRPITRDETIHHRNGVRDDNRIENLELRVGAHPQGMSVEDACAWAKTILDRYEVSAP
jgi:hypothetical protein